MRRSVFYRESNVRDHVKGLGSRGSRVCDTEKGVFYQESGVQDCVKRVSTVSADLFCR